MKKGNFLFGMFCGLLLAPVFYFALSYVKDAISEPHKDPIEQALTNLSGIRKATDPLLLGQQQETINSGFLAPEQYPGAQVVYQAQGGDIIFMLDNNALVWLHPQIDGERVQWRCLAASAGKIPYICTPGYQRDTYGNVMQP